MKATKKISIDFSTESIDLMEKSKINYFLTNKKKASNSLIVNNLIKKILGCPNSLSVEIIKSLNSLVEHYSLLLFNKNHDRFIIEDYNKKIELLNEIIMLFNTYKTTKEDKMRKIKLSNNRSIVFPENWIIINKENALKSTEGYVLECRNHEKYNIPHFLILGDEKAMKNGEYTNEFKTNFYKRILDVFPDFQYVLDNQIESVMKNGKIENYDEYESSPTIGIFKVINSEDLKKMRIFDKRYEPPYGAVVEINSEK